MTWISQAFFLLVCFLLLDGSESAHSRKRPVVYARSREEKYDRSITTFDSAGRLLQVEYGRNAAERGASVMAYIHRGDSKNRTSPNSLVKRDAEEEEEQTAESIYIVVSSSSFWKVHRLDHHVFLLTAGLVGDGRFLASHLRKHCQSSRQAYGYAPSIRSVAQQAARVQHYLTRTAGARPLGVSAMVLGFDPEEPEESHSTARIFRTDPGGVLEDCHYFAAGQHQDAILRSFSNAIDSQQLQNATSRHDIVSVMLKAMAEATENNHFTVDVWVLERNHDCRGNLQATCWLNVRADRLDEIEARLQHESS